MREKRAHGKRAHRRKPRLHDAHRRRLATGGAAGGGHVRHQQRRFGMRAAHPLDERHGGAGLAQGNRVHPENAAARRPIAGRSARR
jgi:hypothetical protein